MYIFFDVGGTKTRITSSHDLESFSDPIILETPKKFEDGISQIVKTAQDLSSGEKILAVAGGVAASLNSSKTRLVGGGPNIEDWLNKPIKMRLEESLNTDVFIENDTAMGGLAQVSYGLAKNYKIAVYITVSTGVGGCRFVDGKIDKSTMGFEPGWQIIGCPEICSVAKSSILIDQDDEWLSGYCSKGYLITHIGGACVEKKENKKPYDITDKNFWDRKAKILAYGIHNVCVMWSPEIIIIGGSMMNKIGISIDMVKHYLEKTLKDVFPNTIPEIVRAEFGDQMGLYGAMTYLKQIKSD